MVNLVVKNLIPPGPAVSNTGKFTVDIVRVKNTDGFPSEKYE